jgi:hypothetical protein
MDKSTLIEKIKLKNYSHDQLLGWVNALPGSNITRKPSESKVGDVYMHPIFLHPYILLEQQEEHWLCSLITSDENCPEILEACKSRFFNNNYFTKVLFAQTENKGSFVNVYENDEHVRKVTKKLKNLFK